jgi:NAD(P)-dependent dehydrogenase (short-subunit alcohol dehydrogenase family)
MRFRTCSLRGSIINTSSADGHTGDASRSAYSASKGAVQAFTRNVATQYGKRGIRCNAVSPGIIVTELVDMAVPQQTKDRWLRHTLTPRLGIPEDIAALVTLLASDEAAYITGQTIVVDGGQTAHQPWWADEQ